MSFDRKKYMEEYREKNKERLIQYRKEYYRKNAEICREKKAKYYRAHKEEKAAYDKIYMQVHKEELAAKKKIYKQKVARKLGFVDSNHYTRYNKYCHRNGIVVSMKSEIYLNNIPVYIKNIDDGTKGRKKPNIEGQM